MTENREIGQEELEKIIDERIVKAKFAAGKLAHGEPEPAAEPHPVYDFMASCPNCGQHNPNYRKPTHRYKNCKVPVNTDQAKCWNCAGEEAEKIEE